MKIPKPHEIGLPEKFASWRPDQEHAIDVMITSTRRVSAVAAPTGFGKSATYVAAALHSGKRTCIVTDSRGLQDQLLADFHTVGMVDIRGRRNYQCMLKPDYTCEDGRNARCPFMGSVGCPNSKAEIQAARSKLVVTNYDKWTAAKKYGTGMEGFEQVIFDEAHSAPDAVARAMQVVLNHREIEEELGHPFLYGSESEEFANWKPWAQDAIRLAEPMYNAAVARITGVSDPKTSHVKKVTHLRNLVRRLGLISRASSRDWVVDQIKDGYQFDPIRPGRYAEMSLLLRVPRIIMVSATLRPKTMYMLGIKTTDFDFKEFDSSFDPKRCPIYHIPTQRVDAKHPDMSMVWLRHDQIASKRRHTRGMVHTISYARRDQIVEFSRFATDMLISEKGEAPTSMVETFKNTDPPVILVSPSVGTGYDFPHDACRWQMILKVPFQPPSKIVKAREAEDRDYRNYQAMQKLVQMCGRPMRDQKDWCETFIPDDNLIDWFLPRNAHFAPRSFHGFFQSVRHVPAPPEYR